MSTIRYKQSFNRSDYIKLEEFKELFDSVEWDKPHRDWKRLYFSVNDMSTTIVARDESNKVVGFISCMSNGLHCYVHTLIVHKEYQRQGIGTQLLNELIKEFSTYNITLHTRHAREFYEKNGFVCGRSNFIELNLTGEED